MVSTQTQNKKNLKTKNLNANSNSTVKQVVEKFEKFEKLDSTNNNNKPIKGWAARLSTTPPIKTGELKAPKNNMNNGNKTQTPIQKIESNTAQIKETKETKEVKEVTEVKEIKEIKEINDKKEPKEIKVVKGTEEVKENIKDRSQSPPIDIKEKEKIEEKEIFESMNQFNSEEISKYLSNKFNTIINDKKNVKYYKNSENSSWIKPSKKRNGNNNKDGNIDGIDILFEINKSISAIN